MSAKDSVAAAAVPAASALVLRACAGGAEVLIVRRHRDLRFLGGYWVFPGGAMDATDAGVPVVGQHQDGCGPPAPFYAAAARELFEETGLLIATVGGDALAAATSASDTTSRYAVPTPGAHSDFAALLLRENVSVALNRFQPWAHWITPSLVRRRFDTWFFVVPAPPGQTPKIDGAEIDAALWVQPVAWASGQLAADYPITPPTQLILRELAEELAARGSLDALLAAASRRPIPTMLPKLLDEIGNVVLPWDPEYDATPGEGCPLDADAIAARRGWPSRLPARIGRASSGTPDPR